MEPGSKNASQGWRVAFDLLLKSSKGKGFAYISTPCWLLREGDAASKAAARSLGESGSLAPATAPAQPHRPLHTSQEWKAMLSSEEVAFISQFQLLKGNY